MSLFCLFAKPLLTVLSKLFRTRSNKSLDLIKPAPREPDNKKYYEEDDKESIFTADTDPKRVALENIRNIDSSIKLSLDMSDVYKLKNLITQISNGGTIKYEI